MRWVFPETKVRAKSERPPELRIYSACIDHLVDAERAFIQLYGTYRRAFWLDSSRVEPGAARFSFMGAPRGPSGEVLTYRVGSDAVTVEPAIGTTYEEPGDIFDVLEARCRCHISGGEDLPFDLTGGYVGYFGYELKGILGASRAHAADTVDALWMRADQLLAFDHQEHCTYLVAVADPADPMMADAARSWLRQTSAVLRDMVACDTVASSVVASDGEDLSFSLAGWMDRSRHQYLADIQECKRQLKAGDSYEICLTNQFRLPAPQDDLKYYARLRRINPAPYAALVRFDELAIHCSSPERFLRVTKDRVVESKPIKGTCPRGADATQDGQLRRALVTDAKTRAEHLMIVDLLRSDLGRVCEIGSICVPKFMLVESYSTVHQLVSTIRGALRNHTSAVQCTKACFPGGSMTGAPKLRTMEIIDGLERQARGVYSGALGYFGFNGCADLNIVIRTAVRSAGQLSVGAGGAIVIDSDPVAEYEEMMLKARTTLRALPR